MTVLISLRIYHCAAAPNPKRHSSYLEPAAVFCVKLRPTGINENASNKKRSHKSKFVNFQGGGNGNKVNNPQRKAAGKAEP